jgi:5-methylcytosine-specific restriction protein A
MQFCGEPGCGVLVSSGRCATHVRTRPMAQRSAGHAWYSYAAWRRLRLDVLRDEPFCRVCRAAGRNTVATDIDHIVKHGGDRDRFFDRGNLQSLCHRCHTAKTVRGA